MIGLHVNRTEIAQMPKEFDGVKLCYQTFFGSPLTYEGEGVYRMKASILPYTYIHSKYIGNMIDGSYPKFKSLRQEMNQGSKGVIVHLFNSKKYDSEYDALTSLVQNLKKYNLDDPKLMIENPDNSKYYGTKLKDLAFIARRSKVSFCLDTCHLWVTGTDISTRELLIDYLTDFFLNISFDRLRLIHLNDSSYELGSNQRPHHEVLKGKIINTKNIPVFLVLNNMGVDLMLERGVSTGLTSEIKKVIRLKNKLTTTQEDSIKNEISTKLINKYLLFFRDNVYNPYKERAYDKAYDILTEEEHSYWKGGKFIPLRVKGIGESVLKTINEIGETWGTSKVLYPKIPYLKEEEYKILKERDLIYADDMIKHLREVKRLVKNKAFIAYLTLMDRIKPIRKSVLRPFVESLRDVYPVGSYSRKKEDDYLSDLDLLTSTVNLPSVLSKLDKYDHIFLRNGDKYKSAIVTMGEHVFLLDIFIVPKITKEILERYRMSKKELIAFRSKNKISKESSKSNIS